MQVSNRHDFVAIKADTELAKPEGLQEKINQQVAKFKHGRSFVRYVLFFTFLKVSLTLHVPLSPSGTEDVVRVYAEADTQENADLLANIVCGLVYDGYGGVGERPTKFRRVDANGNLVK